jgi:hypothetical protein
MGFAGTPTPGSASSSSTIKPPYHSIYPLSLSTTSASPSQASTRPLLPSTLATRVSSTIGSSKSGSRRRFEHDITIDSFEKMYQPPISSTLRKELDAQSSTSFKTDDFHQEGVSTPKNVASSDEYTSIDRDTGMTDPVVSHITMDHNDVELRQQPDSSAANSNEIWRDEKVKRLWGSSFVSHMSRPNATPAVIPSSFSESRQSLGPLVPTGISFNTEPLAQNMSSLSISLQTGQLSPSLTRSKVEQATEAMLRMFGTSLGLPISPPETPIRHDTTIKSSQTQPTSDQIAGLNPTALEFSPSSSSNETVVLSNELVPSHNYASIAETALWDPYDPQFALYNGMTVSLPPVEEIPFENEIYSLQRMRAIHFEPESQLILTRLHATHEAIRNLLNNEPDMNNDGNMNQTWYLYHSLLMEIKAKKFTMLLKAVQRHKDHIQNIGRKALRTKFGQYASDCAVFSSGVLTSMASIEWRNEILQFNGAGIARSLLSVADVRTNDLRWTFEEDWNFMNTKYCLLADMP